MGDSAKEKWYPGKYIGRNSKRRSVEFSKSGDEPEQQRRQSSLAVAVDVPESLQDSFTADASPDLFTLDQERIGTLQVSVVDIKYLRINSAKLTIQLDRALSQYAVDNTSKCFERSFELAEITSDIRIIVSGKGDNGDLVCGLVVIPVASLLTFAGKPAASKEQWRQLYPVSFNRASDTKPFKFTAGYADLPGYCLNRSKDPLGFLCVKVDLALTGTLLSTYFARGSTGWKKVLACAPWADNVSYFARFCFDNI
jgi:hypothetical protein